MSGETNGTVTLTDGDSAVAPDGRLEAMQAVYEETQAAAAEGRTPPTPKEILAKLEAAKKAEAAAPATAPAQTTEAKSEVKSEEAKTASLVDTVVASAGLKMDELVSTFNDAGDLTADQYAALAKQGVDEATVKAYLSGQTAVAKGQLDEYRSSVLKGAGITDENLPTMLNWAASNLSADEQAAYNKSIESGNVQVATMAAQWLQQRFAASNQPEPTLLHTGDAGGGAGMFKSMAEMKEAMLDPRYAKDPAYQAAVKSRIPATGF